MHMTTIVWDYDFGETNIFNTENLKLELQEYGIQIVVNFFTKWSLSLIISKKLYFIMAEVCESSFPESITILWISWLSLSVDEFNSDKIELTRWFIKTLKTLENLIYFKEYRVYTLCITVRTYIRNWPFVRIITTELVLNRLASALMVYWEYFGLRDKSSQVKSSKI